MFKLYFSIITIGLLLCGINASAQKNKELTVEVTYAKKLGTTSAIRDLVPVNISNPEKRKRVKAKYKVPKNFIGRFPSREIEGLEHLPGQESVRQKTFDKGFSTTVEPIVNVDGLSDGFSPSDPTGAVGHEYYLQAINSTTVGVFTKDGNLTTTFTGNTLWSELGFTSAGDPIILYDHEFDRWLITEFPIPNQLLVAISLTDDPLGEYDVYNFATPQFPDYPKYGIWSNAISVTTNEGGSSTFFSYFINRAELLAGADVVQIQRIGLPGTTGSEQGFVVATPVTWSGDLAPVEDKPIVVALNDATWNNDGQEEDEIMIYSLEIDWLDENNTSYDEIAVPVAPYDSNPCSASGFGFACIPQLNGNGLDGIPELIMNLPHYTNFDTHESLVLNFVTDATDGDDVAGIRWIEMRREPGGEWSSYQEGTFAPDDGRQRFMGSIAMDAHGNIGLAYSIAGENDYASIGFTGRRADDPLGEMTIEEYIAVLGEEPIQSGGRFGDYSQMTLDPSDEKTFWFTGEYAKDGVSTRIVSFKLQPDSFDIGPIVLDTPKDGTLTSMESISVDIRNFGLVDVDDYELGFIFENEFEVIESSSVELTCVQGNTYTFTPSVDMSEVGDYTITVFTKLSSDQNLRNDSMTFIVSHLPPFDASIAFTGEDSDAPICNSESSDIEFQITNLGTVDLSTALIRVSNSGFLLEEFTYTGLLARGESETFIYTVTSLVEGNNNILIEILSPNGEVDFTTSNNQAERTIVAQPNNVIINLEILTDDYPGETTWFVFDENQAILATGGPYSDEQTLYIEELCLNPELCYRFLISDSEGDGLQFSGIEGNYLISDSEGNALASILEVNFGNSELNNFCATFECNINADFEISPVNSTGGGGTIIVNVTNGAGPFLYSLDGGVTFQEDNIFTDLTEGVYSVTVIGLNECTFESTVMLFAVSTQDVNNENDTVVFYPNPTDGIFKIELTGLNSNELFIPVTIFDQKGKKVENNRLAKYDDKYVGSINIYPHPAGVYYVKIHDSSFPMLRKIIRN